MARAEEKSKTEEQPKAEDAKTDVKAESEEKPADTKSTSKEDSKTETKAKTETPSKSEEKPKSKANESPNQFVEKHGNKWAVRQEGSDETTDEFDTRVEAVGRARKLAGEKGGTVYIFRQGEPADA